MINGMNTRCNKHDPRHIGLVFLLASALFGIGIRLYDVWPPDEPRFAQVAREMLQSGNYLNLTVNGEAYTEKPPLLFWAMAWVGHFFGDVTEMAARVPSVAAAVGGVLFTYGLAARMFGPRVGLWSALILMTSFRWWFQARTGTTDMLIAGTLAGCIYSLWRWDESRRGRWLLATYFFLTAALYAKGPPALVFLLLAIIFFYRGEPYTRKGTHWVAGSLIALFLVALWYIPARLLDQDPGSPVAAGGMGENIFRNTIGRMFLGTSKAQPPWYYMETLPADLMPWTLFLPWAIAKAWRERREDRAMRYLMAWTVPALIFFSISVGKRATYILPLFPIFAIFLARGVLAFMDEGEANARWRKRIQWIWCGGLVVLGVGTLIAPWLTVQDIRIPTELRPRVWLFGVLLLLFATYAVLRHRYARRSPLHRVIAGQMALIWLAAVGTLFPVVNVFQSARQFCAPLRYLAEQGEEYRLYSLGFTREAYVYYAKHFHQPVLTEMLGAGGLSLRELERAAKAQKAAKTLIQDAVDAVPIGNIDEVKPEEVAKLRTAIESAVAGAGDEAAPARAVEEQLRAVLDGFAASLGSEAPAFFFVQDDDWRWMLPLQTTPPRYFVVRQQRVGSREVLLVANEAGKKLLERRVRGATLS